MASGMTGSVRLVLEPNLDIKAASPLARQLLAVRGQDVTIDASEVKKLGAQCLQVLLSAFTTWHADIAHIDVENESDAFVQGLAILGISKSELIREDIHR
jgi:chemotaxis protein CheX